MIRRLQCSIYKFYDSNTIQIPAFCMFVHDQVSPFPASGLQYMAAVVAPSLDSSLAF